MNASHARTKHARTNHNLSFHEIKNGMSVMDDRHCLATAKPTSQGWLLTLHGACWIDPRARAVNPTKPQLPSHKFPNLMVVRTRGEARRILSSLVP